MSAASPGVIALFFRDDHYGDREAYLFAIADAMRDEYEAIAAAGFVLQIDCPDLAMGRHIQFADRSARGVPARGAAEHRGAEPRAGATSPPSGCACTSAGATTRGRTTTTCRSPTSSTSCSRRARARSRFEAANPRHAHEWRVFEDVKLPDGKVLIPGVIDSKTNFIEHPELVAQRIGRYAKPGRAART